MTSYFIIVDIGTGAARVDVFTPAGALHYHSKTPNDGLFLPGQPRWTFDADKIVDLKKFIVREINQARHLHGNTAPVHMVATQGARNLSKADRQKFCKLFNIPGVGNLKIITGEEESRLCAEAISVNMPRAIGLSVHIGNGSLDVAQIKANGNIPVCVTRPDGLQSQVSNIFSIINDIRITCPQGQPIHASGTVFSKLMKDLYQEYPAEFGEDKNFYQLRLGRIEALRDDLSADDFDGNKDKLYALNIILGYAERFGSSGVVLHKTGIREALAARALQGRGKQVKTTSFELSAVHA